MKFWMLLFYLIHRATNYICTRSVMPRFVRLSTRLKRWLQLIRNGIAAR